MVSKDYKIVIAGMENEKDEPRTFYKRLVQIVSVIHFKEL
jgi:hypothetical protein